MRIYAAADLHNREDYIRRLQGHLAIHQPDLLVLAGDITNYFSQKRFIQFSRSLNIPVVYIRGNSDFQSLDKKLNPSKKSVIQLESTPLFRDDIQIMGVHGTIPIPFASRVCFFENKALSALGDSITSFSIIVVHPPPRGILDKVGNKFSAGSWNLKKFILTHQPLVLICGHIHEQAGIEMCGSTTVVNCAMDNVHSGAVIEIENQMVKDAFMVKEQVI